MSDDIKIQFEISCDKLNELEKLSDIAGFKTKTELLNNALTLLEWTVKKIERGNKIATIDEANKSYHELSMPFFKNIKRQPPQNTKPKLKFFSLSFEIKPVLNYLKLKRNGE